MGHEHKYLGHETTNWGELWTLLEVWVLRVGMSTLGRKRLCTSRIGDPQVLMTMDHPQCDFAAPGLILRQRFQIGMFRPIRLDHTNCLQVAIKTHSFIHVKTTTDNDRNKGKHWDWETVLRLLNSQTHYPPGCDHYNTFVIQSWKDTHIKFERSTYCMCYCSEEPTSYQLKGLTSPRIVTRKQHSKHTGMWPIVLSIHSFINIPSSPYRPSCMVLRSFCKPLSREIPKKHREQYLGSLKESLNKTIDDRWIFQLRNHVDLLYDCVKFWGSGTKV